MKNRLFDFIDYGNIADNLLIFLLMTAVFALAAALFMNHPMGQVLFVKWIC